MDLGRIGQRMVQAMGAVGEAAQAAFQGVKEFTLATKNELKPKFSKETLEKNVKSVRKGLTSGSIRVAKKTAGVTLLGMMMITPKGGSKTIRAGLKLLGRDVGKDYGSYKREKTVLQARGLFALALRGIGIGLKKIGREEQLKGVGEQLLTAGVSTKEKGKTLKSASEQKIGELRQARPAEEKEAKFQKTAQFKLLMKEARSQIQQLVSEGVVEEKDQYRLIGEVQKYFSTHGDKLPEGVEKSDNFKDNVASVVKLFSPTLSTTEKNQLFGTLGSLDSFSDEQQVPPPVPERENDFAPEDFT